MEGEVIDGELFDGKRKTAIFPGDLPENPDSLFQRLDSKSQDSAATAGRDQRRALPPAGTGRSTGGLELTVPHIRLDRALEFLIGDRLA